MTGFQVQDALLLFAVKEPILGILEHILKRKSDKQILKTSYLKIAFCFFCCFFFNDLVDAVAKAKSDDAMGSAPYFLTMLY